MTNETNNDKNHISWDHTGSLFWLASELRKIRLFLEPEIPSGDRVLDSLEQALHHATKLNFDDRVTAEITQIFNAIKEIGFENLSASQKHKYADRLRIAMDAAAGLAMEAEKDFQPGPKAGGKHPHIK